MNEPELIRRARRGDDAAWAQIAAEHQQAVYRLAYLITGSPHDAADVAQDAFIRALRGLDRFDASRPLRPWLLQIARNLARNHHRSLRRYRAALRRRAQQEPEPVLRPVAQSDDQRRAQRLWEAVKQLKAQDREAIYMRHFLELPTEEAAAALGIAPGTIKSRLHRALARLKELIEREYPDLIEGNE